MSRNISPRTTLSLLMDKLASKDGMVRQEARTPLVALGKPAVTSLNRALQHSASDQVRREAAKALGAIGDARSIPPLVKALSDSNSDVAWLAAEASSTFQKAAWPGIRCPLNSTHSLCWRSLPWPCAGRGINYNIRKLLSSVSPGTTRFENTPVGGSAASPCCRLRERCM
jgi:hypothetical protein